MVLLSGARPSWPARSGEDRTRGRGRARRGRSRAARRGRLVRLQGWKKPSECSPARPRSRRASASSMTHDEATSCRNRGVASATCPARSARTMTPSVPMIGRPSRRPHVRALRSSATSGIPSGLNASQMACASPASRLGQAPKSGACGPLAIEPRATAGAGVSSSRSRRRRPDEGRCPFGSGGRTSQRGSPGPPSPPQPPSHRDLTRGGVGWEAAAAPRSRACRDRPHPPAPSPMAMGEGEKLIRGRAWPSPAPPDCRGVAASQRTRPPVSHRDGGRGAGDSGEPYFPRPPDGRRAAASRRMPPHAPAVPRGGRFSWAPLSGGVGRGVGPASREARFLRSPTPDPRDSG